MGLALRDHKKTCRTPGGRSQHHPQWLRVVLPGTAAVWYEATLAALATLLDERGILLKHEIQERMEELIQEEVLRHTSTPAGTF